MKKHIFDKFTDAVCHHTKLDQKDIFTKSKEPRIVLARQSLFYLCLDRGLTRAMITEYMAEEGYNIGGAAIAYGITVIKNLIETDPDFKNILDELSKIDDRYSQGKRIIIKEKIDKNEEPPKIYKNKGWKGWADFLGKKIKIFKPLIILIFVFAS